MKLHLLALLIGTILDFIVGDPHWIWHPVRLIGNAISGCEKLLLGETVSGERVPDETVPGETVPGRTASAEEDKNAGRMKRKKGVCLVIIIAGSALIITAAITFLCYRLHPALGVAFEAVISCYCLAGKSLYLESKRVVTDYQAGGITAARYALSMIVGRDTADLGLEGILKATVETIAENASDGVFAPFLYLLLLGPAGGMTYKAINTMDSMVGYHNEKYEDFGRAAARLDDAANFIPSRLTGLLTVFTAWIIPFDYSGREALRIFLRDRLNHKSPNSAQSEAAFAGALGVQLGGGASYFGKFVSKPTIGDKTKEIEISDVGRAHRLLLGMVLICEIVPVCGLAIAWC